MTLRTAGVIGAGTIGRGVAEDLAQAAYDVILVDISEEQLSSALTQIRSDILVYGMFRSEKPKGDVETVVSHISVSTDLARLSSADFIVENVTEDWDIKRDIYQQIDAICRPGVIFGVNTSAIPITRVAAATTRPSDVIGMHFMNPVPLIGTVEVIRGCYTSDQTVHAALDILQRLGKEGIIVQDSPGFVTNRVLMLTINEAIFCVQDQVASAEEVDRIFKGCFAHKMGPLETGDLIGLDTILNSITVMYENFRDSKYRPAPLLVKMVEAGLLGRKTGRGFYTY